MNEARLRQGRHDFRFVKAQRDELLRAIKEHASHHPDDRDEEVDRKLYRVYDRIAPRPFTGHAPKVPADDVAPVPGEEE